MIPPRMRAFDRFLQLVKFLVLAVCLPLPMAQAAETHDSGQMILVENGKSLAPIILPKDPTYFTKIAAKDLAEYMGKATGVKPEILEGLPDPVPEHAMWVGFQPKLKELFPETDFDFKNPEEILIKSDGKNLVIVGRDVFDPKAMFIKKGESHEEVSGRLAAFEFNNRDLEGFQFEYGTVNAVYSFLQDHLGVRWLWPGKDGEVVPKQNQISFIPFESRYYPKNRMRHCIFHLIAVFKKAGASGVASGDWVRRQRVQLDSLHAPSMGRGFMDWYERFHETHPDYFALQANGSRKWTESPESAKICQANPEVWDQWIKDVEEVIEKTPSRNVFNAAVNSAYPRGICTCDKCSAWDNSQAEERLWLYRDGETIQKIKGLALADREIRFANTLGRKLKERFPDKDYKVFIGIAGYLSPAPIKEIPDDNVIVALSYNFLLDQNDFDDYSPNKTRQKEQFEDWVTKTKNGIWRPNIIDPDSEYNLGWTYGGPVDILGAGKIFQEVAAKPVLGFTFDMVFPWWAMHAPLYYVMAQLAWDPDKSVDGILEDYYRSGFGPASEKIKSYFAFLEIPRLEMTKKKKNWIEVFTPVFFDRANAILDKACGKVKGEKEYLDRIEFLRAGLDYLRLNTENQILVKASLALEAPDPLLKEKIRSNWKRIEEIAKKQPEALNGGFILAGMKGKLAYIHPDADHKELEAKKKARQEYMDNRIRMATNEGEVWYGN